MSNAWDKTNSFPSPLPARGGHAGGAPEPTAAPEAVTRVLKRVRQTRDFLADPVPEAALTDILDVARWTGSGGNRQPWTFIVVTDAETKRRMAEIATNTPHIGIAPVVICVATEPHGNVESENYDEGRLTERIMIAATAHGLGCGIGRARREAQAAIGGLLGVPEDRVLRSMVSVGYPTEPGKAPKSPRGQARRPLAEVVRRERFS
jgi:nitroreductase